MCLLTPKGSRKIAEEDIHVWKIVKLTEDKKHWDGPHFKAGFKFDEMAEVEPPEEKDIKTSEDGRLYLEGGFLYSTLKYEVAKRELHSSVKIKRKDMSKFNIYVVLKVKRENRRQLPVALCAFVSKDFAESYRDEIIKSDKIKEDDIWVETVNLTTFCYEDYEDIVWKNRDGLKKDDTVFVHWMTECKRPLCGFCNYVFAEKKEAEKYFNEVYPIEDREYIKDHFLLECKISR